MTRKSARCGVVSVILGTALSAHGATIYVDDDAPGDPGPGDPAISNPFENGSVGRPFDAIQEAIDVAAAGDLILVAEGTYIGPGNRDLSFGGLDLIVEGVGVAVIDLQGTPTGFVFENGETAASELRTLTIRNGDSPTGGAAVRCSGGSTPTLRGCTFEANETTGGRGGAVLIDDAPAMHVEACEFIANRVTDDVFGVFNGGAGLAAANSGIVLVACTFEGNEGGEFGGADIDDALGGALMVEGGSCTVVGGTITGNRIHEGSNEPALGGAFGFSDCVVTITGASFADNEVAGEGRGGAIGAILSSLEVTDCVFTSNVADAYCLSLGGAVMSASTENHFTRCRFQGNRALSSGFCAGSSTARFGAVYAEEAAFVECDFLANGTGAISSKFGETSGGAASLAGTFDRCRFIGNRSAYGGALAPYTLFETSVAQVRNCLFVDNIAQGQLDSENDIAGVGGAILGSDGSTIVNSTFVGNEARSAKFEAGEGAGIYWTVGVDVANCIVRGNVPDQLSSTVGVRSSNVEGIVISNGNIDVDPNFVDAAGGDYRLAPGSLCIDAGSALEAHGELDLDGNPRALDDPATPNIGAGDAPHPDMGAFEFQPAATRCAADLDDSGAVDFNDMLQVLSDWGPCAGCASDLNGDGDVSLSDLLQVLAAWGPCS